MAAGTTVSSAVVLVFMLRGVFLLFSITFSLMSVLIFMLNCRFSVAGMILPAKHDTDSSDIASKRRAEQPSSDGGALFELTELASFTEDEASLQGAGAHRRLRQAAAEHSVTRTVSGRPVFICLRRKLRRLAAESAHSV